MKKQHTPGPWVAEKGGRVLASPIGFKPTPGRPVFVVANNVYISAPDDEMIANARLIAAAPELLEALEMCRLVLSGEEMTMRSLIKSLELAQKAIHKAKGEP